MSEMVEIDKDKLDELIKDSAFLNALRAAGVDNWDGYNVAVDIMDEWNGED